MIFEFGMRAAPGGPVMVKLPPARVERLYAAARLRRYQTVTPFEAVMLGFLAAIERQEGIGDADRSRAANAMGRAVIAKAVADRAAQGEDVTTEDVVAEAFDEARRHERDGWRELEAQERAYEERDREALRRAKTSSASPLQKKFAS